MLVLELIDIRGTILIDSGEWWVPNRCYRRRLGSLPWFAAPGDHLSVSSMECAFDGLAVSDVAIRNAISSVT
jgi:hypothetical protein